MEIKKISSLAIAAQHIKKVPTTKKVKKQFVSKFYANRSMTTIYSLGMEFCWVSTRGTQCMPFASCRDHIQGAVWAAYTKKDRRTHSFTFEPGKEAKVDLNNMRLLVRYKSQKNETFKQYCKNSLAFIQEIEKEMDLPKSVLVYGGVYVNPNIEETLKAENEARRNSRLLTKETVKIEPIDTWVFKGDKSWMRSLFHTSMYSLLIRTGVNYTGGPWREHTKKENKTYISEHDKVYLEEALRGMEEIVKDKKQTLFAKLASDNFPEDLQGAHPCQQGIKNFSMNSVAPQFKVKWQDKDFKFDNVVAEKMKDSFLITGR